MIHSVKSAWTQMITVCGYIMNNNVMINGIKCSLENLATVQVCTDIYLHSFLICSSTKPRSSDLQTKKI